MIDLHTHSRASDGELSPSRLIEAAADRGISAIALTDHDTLAGIAGAKDAAERRSIRFIPGIELEINWTRENDRGEFHLLGLGIREPTAAFTAALEDLAKIRENRNLEILERMRGLNIHAEYEELRSLSGGVSIGRPHFAALLIKRKIVKNQEQAFQQYLGRGKPLYAPKEGLEFQRAAALIRESGGITALAHPTSLYLSWGRLPDMVRSLRDQGLQGIEAWHPTATVRCCKRLEELGKSLGLFITAGSDYHGESRFGRKLGLTAGGRKIDEAILEAIPPLA